MAADSRTTLYYGRMSHTQGQKIFSNGDLLIASAGSIRGNNLLKNAWKPPKPKLKQDLDDFVTQDLLPSMRSLFINSGYDMKDDGEVALHENEFIIAVQGVVYHVYEDYSWERTDEGLYAAGTGGDYALAAFMAFERDGLLREDRDVVLSALEASVFIAERIDIYSGGDVQVVTQDTARPLTRGSSKVAAKR
jgi:ATP-dependent protease HslVU (ClpYQ) peptidase subunit